MSDVHNYVSDAALVSEAQVGDESAFEELCRRHSSKLIRSILRILRDHADAEDVLQETLFKAFTHLNSFEGRSSVSTWLTRIAINTALMALRKKSAGFVSLDDSSDDSRTGQVLVLRDGAPDPECQLMQKQKETLLGDEISRLPPRLRSVVELRVRDGYSGKEIAGKLGISESAVKARLWRAQMRLQSCDRIRPNRLGQPERTIRGLLVA